MRNPNSNSHYNNVSFKGKTLEEYKIDYPNLLDYYKKQHIDNDEINFIESEMLLINESIRLIIEHQKSELEEKEEIDLYKLMMEPYLSSYKKIIQFLETRELELKPISSTFEPLDLSDAKEVEKIIYLNELGIIDFLRTKTKAGISNNSLASILSGITGTKANTLKPSLNRLTYNDKLDNKHPYYTEKTVAKIKKNLANLGF
jgi:hypothetical protein